jgi:hypothetical protein
MTVLFTMALTPSASSARKGRLRHNAAAQIEINRDQFIKFDVNTNNWLRRVKRRRFIKTAAGN